MIGTQHRSERTLFVAGSLDDLIPDDHILKRVDRVLDLKWLRKEVSEYYCEANGRPGIDPEAAVRLMLAGFFHGIVHDRKLMREAQVNLAIRWFAGYRLDELVERVESATGIKVARVTADAGYAHPQNYKAMEERGTRAIIPPPPERKRHKKLPMRLFKYDAVNKVVRCPGGKYLRRSSRAKKGWVYRAKTGECRVCEKRGRCLPDSANVRTVLIVDGYEAFMRARRERPRWDEDTRRWYNRHRWRVEGVHGEAKTQHGLRRAVRRGLRNVAIQVYLTAAVMNLKRLAAFLWLFLYCMCRCWRGLGTLGTLDSFYKRLSGRCRENPFSLATVA